MPESDHTDEDKDITNKDTDDVELAPLRSTDIIQHKAQDGHEADRESASLFEPHFGCDWKIILNAIHDLAEIMN